MDSSSQGRISKMISRARKLFSRRQRPTEDNSQAKENTNKTSGKLKHTLWLIKFHRSDPYKIFKTPSLCTSVINIINSIVTEEPRQKSEEFKQDVERCLQQKQFHQVVALYTDVLKLDPNNADHYADRASAFFQLKEFSSALSDATKSIEYNENSVKGYSIRATTYMSLNQHELALQDYQKVHELEPSHENERKIETVERIIKGKF